MKISMSKHYGIRSKEPALFCVSQEAICLDTFLTTENN